MNEERFAAMLAALRRSVRISGWTVAGRVIVDGVGMPVDRISERTRKMIVRTAWRYRKQMPDGLVPTPAELEEARFVPKPVRPRGRGRPRGAPAPELPLFGG